MMMSIYIYTHLKTMSSDVPVTLHLQKSLHWQVFQSVMLLASSLVVQRSAMEEAFHRFIIHYNRSVGETREDGRHNLGFQWVPNLEPFISKK